MAFDFVFAVFPGILMLTALLSVLGIAPVTFNGMIDSLKMVVPGPWQIIVEENVQHLWGSSHTLFLFGMVGVLWPASASMSTAMSALNRAYGAQEQRSFWRRRLLSLFLVLGLGMALIFLFAFLVFSRQVDAGLQRHWELYRHFPSLANLLRHLSGAIGTVGVVASVYRLVPLVRQRWLDVLPGSLLFFSLWSLITGGFRYYIEHFGYYNLVYGVLGMVIATLLAAYLVAFILLLGGEFNAVLYKRRSSRKACPSAS